MVRILCFHYLGLGLIPGQRTKILQATEHGQKIPKNKTKEQTKKQSLVHKKKKKQHSTCSVFMKTNKQTNTIKRWHETAVITHEWVRRTYSLSLVKGTPEAAEGWLGHEPTPWPVTHGECSGQVPYPDCVCFIITMRRIIVPSL